MSEDLFNLQANYAIDALAARMAEQILLWNGIDPRECVLAISARMLGLVAQEALDRDFVRWCRSAEAPQLLARLDKKWASLLFTSVALAAYSHRNRSTLLAVSSGMPYWVLGCMTQACAPHSTLDGFAAKFDDPIWQFIYPPNGWMCGCSVLAFSGDEREVAEGLGRAVPPELKRACISWLHVRPNYQYGLL